MSDFLTMAVAVAASLTIGYTVGDFDPKPAQALPICQLEDGSDVDGQCIWIDPDTGNAYINPTPEEVK